jgi:S1-C subfamily serine protease
MALRGRKPSAAFSPNEAKFILEQMVRDGRVSRADLDVYRQRMKEEAHSLLERLRALGWNEAASAAASAVVGAAVVAAAPLAARGVRKAAKRARRMTAEQAAGMKLQGQYLSRVRRFPATRRAEFAKIAKTDGREAAIKAMDAALGASAGGGEAPATKTRGRKRRAKK